MRLTDCHNIADFRELARRRLPWPVFDYIDGAADDELTKARNTEAFARADLVPDVLAGVETIDTSCTILGRTSALPLILSPTALQRVFHWQGERAVARAAEKFGVWCGISSLATVSIEEIGALISTPKMFQLYVHKDKGLNQSMIERCKAAKFDAIALTVDTIVSGNRERCLRSGFTSPPRFTPASVLSYAIHPMWALNYLFREKFALPNLETHVDAGTNVAVSVAEYFKAKGITVMEGDWTRNDPTISAWLADHKRAGVPVYVYYDPAGGETEFLDVEMSAAAGAERTGNDFSGLRAGKRDEVIGGFHAERRRDREDVVGVAHQRDRREILDRVVRKVEKRIGRGGMRAGRADHH